MNTEKLNVERLRKLADHLVSEECKDLFYMVGPLNIESQGLVVPIETLPSLDAAISESYKIFPGEWVWNDEDEIAYLPEDQTMDPCKSAMIFFGLDDSIFRHLFTPFNQDPERFGGTMLETIITPSHIGDNIFRFLDRYTGDSK
jgi:hypothetical protein